jgi:hypothetical protein
MKGRDIWGWEGMRGVPLYVIRERKNTYSILSKPFEKEINSQLHV